MSKVKLTGVKAIVYAYNNPKCILHKYADPTEGAAEVSLDKACRVAAEDPGLIWVEVESEDIDEREVL